MYKTHFILLAMALILVPALIIGCSQSTQGPGSSSVEPIVIGYVGSISGPGTKPCIDAQKMAVEEINAAGGILGRPIKFMVEDTKGETSLAVAGVTRMVMGHKAIFYSVEGRTEIAMATKQKTIELYKDFPHIMEANGAAGVEVTESVINNYDREKMIFRLFNPEPGHFAWARTIFTISDHSRMKLANFMPKKWAILYENLAWTLLFRNGGPVWNLPTWDQMAKDDCGIDVVYSKPVSARTGMWLPVLDAVSKSGADFIFVVSSWFTDTEVLTKQWADSPARDIQIYFYGGVSQTHDFWKMTGGKALGVLTGAYEVPITENTMPFVEKARARGIPVQQHVACAYDDVYMLKKSVEVAGGVDDVDRLISAMEQAEFDGVIGLCKVEMTRVPGFFHSRVACNPNNPKEEFDRGLKTGQAQVQANGEYVSIWPEKYAQWDRYKPPAQLRAEAGIK